MKKVLIIEDEKLLRDVYAMILKKEGYSVGLAENGKIGIDKLKSFNPDLILLDMLMPVMDGLGFLKSAKLPKNHPAVKTIIVSNLSNPITKNDSQKYGVVKTMLKVNFSPREFVAIVKEHLPS